jgi:hypothetical protein
MPATYEPIATTTLGTAAATISFTSISSAYTDIRYVASIKATASSSIRVQLNGDTGTNYSSTFLWGDGASASSFRNTNSNYLTGSYSVSTTPLLWTFDFFNYAGSTNKTALQTHSNDNNGSGEVARVVGLWRNTAAINRIDLLCAGSTFAAGTTVTLYGILKA